MKIALTLLLALAGTTAAFADSLVTVRPTGSDSVDWAQLGSPFTTVPQQFTFTTTGSSTGSGSLSGGTGQARQQPNSWSGNFYSGDSLLWTTGNGPVTLTFAQSYNQIGAQLQSDQYGAFTAQVCVNTTCFSEAGNSYYSNDGSAIYIGFSKYDAVQLHHIQCFEQ